MSSSPKKPLIHIILASTSKYRRTVLQSHTFSHFHVNSLSYDAPDIDEKAIRDEDPEEMAQRICEAKGQALLERDLMHHRQSNDSNLHYVLITADQVTTHQGVPHEKPETEDEARALLRTYVESGDPCVCLSAVQVWDVTRIVKGEGDSTADLPSAHGVGIAKVFYEPFESEEARNEAIEKVIAKGACMYCAGAITIEDRTLPVRIEGDEDCVYGLPLSLCEELVGQVGMW